MDTITFKAVRGVYLLSQLKRAGISYDDLLAFYCSVIRSVLEFVRIQRRAMRIIFRGLSYSASIKKAGILSLLDRRESLSVKLFNDIVSKEDHKLASYNQLLRSAFVK